MCVIIIAFPLQQCLHEHTWMLCTYIACLAYIGDKFVLYLYYVQQIFYFLCLKCLLIHSHDPRLMQIVHHWFPAYNWCTFGFYCHLNKYLEMLISSSCQGLWTKKYCTVVQFNTRWYPKFLWLVLSSIQQLWYHEAPVDGRTTMSSESVCQVAHS